jgi:hypothetical protein
VAQVLLVPEPELGLAQELVLEPLPLPGPVPRGPGLGWPARFGWDLRPAWLIAPAGPIAPVWLLFSLYRAVRGSFLLSPPRAFFAFAGLEEEVPGRQCGFFSDHSAIFQRFPPLFEK